MAHLDSHPVLAATAAMDEVLKGVADVNPSFMDTAEKATALVELARLETRVAELRILAEAGDVAALTAARDAAAWLAHHTHGRLDEARADLALAQALDRRYPTLARAVRAGDSNRAQAQVIVRALDHLPPAPTDMAGLRLAHPRKLGTAFCQLLENIDPTRLPLHGGDATTVLITVPLETLRHDLGTGDILGASTIPGTGDILGASTIPGTDPTLDSLTAGQIRRLACTAHLIPAVLGGNSEVLDLGRSRRLFDHKQRKALLLTNPTCRAEGCDIPGQWCEAHHRHPWTTGGHTNLTDGVLLCPHHHHRAHDNTWRAERLPNGDIRFHRRT